MQIVNNVQINGWSCFFKHDAAHLTVLKHFSSGWYEAFQKHSFLWLSPAPPNTFQFFSRCWKTFFRLNTMQLFKNHSSLWLGRAPQHPLSLPSSNRGVEHFFSSWDHADCQRRSNQRLFVLPQTWSSSFHGVESVFRLDDMKLFNNIQSYCRTVLCQTRPSSFQGVDQPFRLNVMQPFKNFQV